MKQAINKNWKRDELLAKKDRVEKLYRTEVIITRKTELTEVSRKNIESKATLSTEWSLYMKRVVAALVLMASSSFVIADEVTCLAQNIYWEARNQSIQGMYAVADVTLNRVKDKRWPSTVCEVVKQRRRSRQFSWYCDGKPDTPE